jgi:hypothetical protein
VEAFFTTSEGSAGASFEDALHASAGGARRQAQRAMLGEQLIGFYDEGRGKVFLRKESRIARGELKARRMLLAHEIEHALQHQRFGASRLHVIADEDERLARLALIEGEASLTGIAYVAAREGMPIRRAVVQVTEASRWKEGERLARMHARAPLLARASASDRERLLFPYVEGLDLLIALYRAGGFALIDRAFARPPLTTEQVLHPAKYIAGEGPVPVRSPAAPAGYRPVSRGRMGELSTRALLAGCMSRDAARLAAEGWGGDAFTIVEKDGARAVLWSTAWDSEADAARFEQALRASAACLADAGGAGAFVARDKDKVALVRGLPEALLPGVTAALLALPGERPAAAPPLGDVQLRAVNPPLVGLRGTAWQGLYQSAKLNLVAWLPPAFTASTTTGDAELVIRLPGYLATGVLAVSDRITSPAFNDQVLGEVAGAFAERFKSKLDLTWSGNIALPIGPAVGRLYRLAGTEIGVRLLLVPVCNGTGSYLFAELWDGEAQRDMLNQWVMSFRYGAPVALPVCHELDPE